MIAHAPRYLLLVLLLLGTSASSTLTLAAQVTPGDRSSRPTAGWQTATPEEQGMDPTLLTEASERMPVELPLRSALVVIRGGDIVFEEYYNGQTADEPIHLWSATKSVTNMAVGIAMAEGLLRLDQTLGELIPERIPAGADPRTATVTVENLLTMTGGWAWDSTTDFLHLDDAPDWAARTLGLPMACDPGTCFEYNSGGVHLLSVILQKLTGQMEADYVQARIFDPLGIARPTWGQSPQGETAGAFSLELNPRAAAKLGYLYLNDGVWDGQQLVPAEWVATSTTQHSSGTSPAGINLSGGATYGYLWWVTEAAGDPAYFAHGFGAQVIYVVPELDLIAVAMVAQPNVDQQQNPIPLIEELIVPAALAGPSGAALAAPAAAQGTAAPAATSTVAPQVQVVSAGTPVVDGRIFALPGGGGFPDGIAYGAATGDFYVGSSIDGTIFRGNVDSGEVGLFLPGSPGLQAFGLALDTQGRLYVTGGQNGFAAIYDTASGQSLAELDNGLGPNTFLSDVAVTPDGNAYITDSFNPVLWRIPAATLSAGIATPGAAAPGAAESLEVFLDLSANGEFLVEGFNATGIVATPDGQYLLIVQNNTGSLYRIDVATGAVSQVDLGGQVLTGGNGMALDGQTLYVITGETIDAGEAVTEVDLSGDYASGTVSATFTDPSFAAPTSLALADGCLLVVNSQMDLLQGEPQLPFTVSSVPIPSSQTGTPVVVGSC